MLNPNIDMQKAFKVAKRVAITVLITIPFLFAFAYLTRNIIKSNTMQIFSFVIILFVVVLIEELIARLIEKRKNKVKIENNNQDVFK